MNDIFIDNDAAKKFVNPPNQHYKDLIKWLLTCHDDSSKDAYLVTSQKQLVEYLRSNHDCSKPSSIPVIVNKLISEGRLYKKTPKELKEFIQKIPKKVERRLRSNQDDRYHIATVLLSNRKYALSLDNNLRYDIENFPKFNALARDCPSLIPYK